MAVPSVWYGDARVPVDLPGEVAVRVGVPRPLAAADDPLAVVASALDRPHGAAPLEEAARGCRRAVIVVPDQVCPSGAGIYLLPVIARLARAGLGPGQISIVVARGLHAANSRSDVVRILGPAVMDALRTVQSAPDTPETNLVVGTDAEIGEIRVHRLVAEADLVVLTGAVTPHHLCGFDGGPMVLVPGVAERTTILAAHRLTLRSSVGPDGTVRNLAGRLEDNPFRDVLLRVARDFSRTWLLNVVLADNGAIAAAEAGEVGEAHEAAVGAWRQSRGEAGEAEPADLVVVGAPSPRDRDLIQSLRGLVAALEHVRPGAPIVWFARAPAGAGHASFLPWFEISKLTSHLAALRRDFHPYGLSAYFLRRIAADHPVHVVSEMDADLLRPMGLLPFRDGAAALAHALGHHDVRTCTVLPSPIV